MANDAAWQAGLDMGSGKSKKKTDQSTDPKSTEPKHSGRKKARKGGASAGGGGGNPWSILSVLKKSVGSFKSGGRVKKTGLYTLHKNEYVVPAKHRSGKKHGGHKRSIVKA